jgi:hypothetical protein
MEQLLVMAFAEMVRRKARQMPKPGWVLDKERAERQSRDALQGRAARPSEPAASSHSQAA